MKTLLSLRSDDRHENKAHAHLAAQTHSASISSASRLLQPGLSRPATRLLSLEAPRRSTVVSFRSILSHSCSILSSRPACCTLPAVTHHCHADTPNLQLSVRSARSSRTPAVLSTSTTSSTLLLAQLDSALDNYTVFLIFSSFIAA